MNIERGLYQAEVNNPSIMKLIKYLSYREVAEQFFDIMKEHESVSDPELTLHQISESQYFDMASRYDDRLDDPIPPEMILRVMCSYGNSEGMRVSLVAIDTSGDNVVLKNIAGIKYLAGEDDAWKATRIATEALERAF